MPRLTDTQALLLSSAAARSDLTLLPAPGTLSADGPALDRAINSLLRRGLIAVSDDGRGATSEASTPAEDAAAGGERVFTITPSGLAAIGMEELEDTAAHSAAEAPGETASLMDDAPARPAKERRQGKTTSMPSPGKEAAEVASAPPAVLLEASEPAPRTTKKQRLIALLSTDSGLDIATLSATLGWQTHTTHAALTGLRKAGYHVEGAKPPSGGGQLYRIVAKPATVCAA